ncbi:MAG: DUF3857 domain-containing protein, partial [Bacteroidota bacterium]
MITFFKHNIALLGILLIFSFSVAQEAAWPEPDPLKKVKVGKMDHKWLNMNKFEPDTSAEAVVLMDIGKTEMQFTANNSYTNITIHRRIKILKESALDRASISLTYRTTGKISKIEAFTYNLLDNGEVEVSKLDKGEIFEEKVTKRVKNKKFTLPKVKVGSIIEYKYIQTIDGARQMDWAFQESIPVLVSQYTFSHPNAFVYTTLRRGDVERMETSVRGYNRRIMISSGNSVNLDFAAETFTLKNIPSLRDEPFTTSMDDFRAGLRFIKTAEVFPGQPSRSTMPTWNKIAEILSKDEDFGPYLEKRGEYKKFAESHDGLTAGKSQELAMKIYGTVQKEFEWNGKFGFFASTSIKQFLEEKRGNSGQINLFLTGLFKHLGFEAYPAILSTRGNGQVFTAFPLFNQFDHTICVVKVGEEYLTLDASDKFCRFAMMPTSCLNEKAFLLMGVNPQWINIKPQFPQKQVTKVTMEISPEAVLTGEVTSSYQDANGVSVRHMFDETEEKEEDFAKEMLFEEGDDVTIDDFSIKHENQEEPFVIKTDIETYSFADQIGDFIYLKPMLGQGMDENPLKLKERKFPVDFARNVQWVNMHNFRIPSGYAVESVPKPINMVLPDKSAVFQFQAMANGPFIQIQSRIIISKVKFEPEEY